MTHSERLLLQSGRIVDLIPLILHIYQDIDLPGPLSSKILFQMLLFLIWLITALIVCSIVEGGRRIIILINAVIRLRSIIFFKGRSFYDLVRSRLLGIHLEKLFCCEVELTVFHQIWTIGSPLLCTRILRWTLLATTTKYLF